ncbi:tetratricopeptide repeat protein [Desulfosarcina sp. OttesenSCG-928-A07]|nr:tetratricopeptide repeat protein [Desulfosarcina sp. OttesenSCG-928-A07]
MKKKKGSSPKKKPFGPLLEKQQILLQNLNKRAKECYREGRYEEALKACLQAVRIQPQISMAWHDAAANCVLLQRWEDSLRYVEKAMQLGDNSFGVYDVLSHAHTGLGNKALRTQYGRIALEMRDKVFGVEPPFPHDFPAVLPPPPSPETKKRNIIAFSLFGALSRYCETAVLNAQENKRLYPGWTCRFYLDETVPSHVVKRLADAGSEIVFVDEQHPAKKWPGPMWRFYALSDDLDRVTFRDADSVITQRDALATADWVESGLFFHAMRDSGTHTELLLAGLWGCVTKALPPLSLLMKAYFSKPLESAHFADQYFLRAFVWPYARKSLMHHDSIFGFFHAKPFPDGPTPTTFHVGWNEGGTRFSIKTSEPEGSTVQWALYLQEGEQEVYICTYPGVVQDGMVYGQIPDRYATRILEKTASIRTVTPTPG